MVGVPTDPPSQPPADRKASGADETVDTGADESADESAGRTDVTGTAGKASSDPAQAAYAALRRASRAGGGSAARSTRSSRDGNRGSRRRGYSGSGPDPRDPQPLGRLTDRLVDDRGWRKQTTAATVLGRWEHLVGPEVAARCQPETLRDGELTLVAESTAWATQLRMMAPNILRRLGTELGPDVVQRLRIHGPAAPSWRKGPRTVRGRGPRDTYG